MSGTGYLLMLSSSCLFKVLIISWSLCRNCVLAETEKPPNIVVIVADDLGWNDVGFHGSDQIPTPNLNRLAAQGIILNNYYVQHICTPTRSALLTGRYPIHLGMQRGVIRISAPYGLGLNETLLPEYLNDLGYTSRMLGKWHLGFYAKEYTPTYRGFASHLGYWAGHGDYWDHTVDSEVDGWGLDDRRDMNVNYADFGQYSTEVLTDESERIIDNHDKNKPLFLYFAHKAVHVGNPNRPLEAPWKYYAPLTNITDTRRRTFAAMTVAMDESVGCVYDALSRNDMLNNTIIMFTSDNGGSPTRGSPPHLEGNTGNNWPLRGVKFTLWEGGIRAAAFIWSPLLKSRGRVSRELMHVTDWVPTLLHAAGANLTKLRHLDGVDQWESLSENRATDRREILHNIDDSIFAIRVGDFKLISPNWDMRRWFGWYPPEGETDSLRFHPRDESSWDIPSSLNPKLDDVNRWANLDGNVRDLSKMYAVLGEASKKYDHHSSNSTTVQCGPRPPDAGKNCQPGKPCVYHIPSDPCEYRNLFDKEPDVARILYQRYLAYNATTIPVRNKPADWRADPKYHNDTWSSWMEIDEQGHERPIAFKWQK